MFFVMSKTAGFLAAPSNFLIVAALAGIVLMLTRWAKAGRALAALSIVALAIAGLSPLGNVLMLPLEQRFPAWDASRAAPDGIVVLGGAVGPETSAARGSIELNEAAERMTEAVLLTKRFPAARFVFSGGNASLLDGALSEAQFAGPLFESLGVPRGRILLEGKSRNTAENAEFTAALVKPKPGERWLVVTSAHHMPRAVGCFRKAGFAVEAYPVDWRTGGPRDLYGVFKQASGGLARTDAAAREWIGLVAYWIFGRTSALWPAP